MSDFNFSAASREEDYVFGAQRPGYYASDPIADIEVDKWAAFMQGQGIKRVCCLLESQLSKYESDLLASYRRWFGDAALCSAPIKDFTFADDELLTETILPFLADAVRSKAPVVVHCSAGLGRTGHVLAAWLVYGRGMANEDAIKAVIGMGRNPYEAKGSGADGKAKLNALLDGCRVASTRHDL